VGLRPPERPASSRENRRGSIKVSDPFDLDATLTSGQVFRWRPVAGAWEGVVGRRWVRLQPLPYGRLAVQTAEAVTDWSWLEDYLQLGVDLPGILATFPPDEPLRRAVSACGGLRLLRQDPWECLASFILSSTKQIVQIQAVIAQLCERFGEPVIVPAGHAAAHAFPSPERLAGVSEVELRACRMGFRAKYLREAAWRVASGELDLAGVQRFPVPEAREVLMRLPGVGRKIADCVLLFAFGFSDVFPIDVWAARALRAFYYGGTPVPLRQLHEFVASYFGPHAGYAQQYLFHYIRVHDGGLDP
jgi:N-glycosylase/DNA lyase